MTETCDADGVATAFVVMLKDRLNPEGWVTLRLAFCRHHFNRHHRALIEDDWYVWSGYTESRRLEVAS